MAVIHRVIYAEQRRALRRERNFRPRCMPLDLGDHEFIYRYRVSKDIATTLIDLLGHTELATKTARSHAITDDVKVLTALRFYATGGTLRDIGDLHGLSKATTGQIICSISKWLSSLNGNIKLPTERGEMLQTATKFAGIAGFPRVIGAIDGTHVPIKAPTGDREPVYCNRKGYHSINAQIICDADNTITNLVCRWPGSTHDSFILTNSAVSEAMEAGICQEFWLLGDSGYPCKTYLLTPHPGNGENVNRYNRAHKSTRSVVERTIGIWKSRFRCIDRSSGYLSFSPERCCTIIMATAVLHNMCTAARLPIEDPGQTFPDDNDDTGNHIADTGSGMVVREQLIRTRFS